MALQRSLWTKSVPVDRSRDVPMVIRPGFCRDSRRFTGSGALGDSSAKLTVPNLEVELSGEVGDGPSWRG